MTIVNVIVDVKIIQNTRLSYVNGLKNMLFLLGVLCNINLKIS
jgi:hypothetical protein